jgi:hypothetical protein
MLYFKQFQIHSIPKLFFLGPLATDPAGELHVLWVDRDALCVDGAQVGVLEKTDEVGLGGLLEGGDRRGLEPQVGLELLSNLADEALKGELADEKLGRLLVAADLAEGDGARAVPSAVHSFSYQ